ncbi:hypothetical protein BJ322DRAFT_1110091 [Thelephora terrestris]|uniref:Uncharacterized protein n=1 Tax=Thelephora terrestris TaxID=56493 RepID=A0A9P6L4R0_9AGAM|nr:hypothetical protein BJ322DRAFT_1110091 [Thelephora terrestris]
MLSTTKVPEDDTTRNKLIQRFRSEHADLFLAAASNFPETEFLEQCAVLFQCTACGDMFYFKNAESHGVECVRSSRNSWSIESSAPAQPSIVMAVLSLLKLLGLSQDATLSSATEVLTNVRFACLCGDPRYEGNFDFQGLLGHVISENQEHEEIKSKIVGKTRRHTTNNPAPSNAQLINDHDPYALASKIVRIDHEEPGYDDADEGTSGQQLRVPARRKWDHCNVCLQLTGTKVYFGGNLEYKRYHLSAKHGYDMS